MEKRDIGKVIRLPIRETLGKDDDQEPALSEFYIHAVLQAARAFTLGLSLDASKSWGLNRAIFYKAVKDGYIGNYRRARKDQNTQTGTGGFIPRSKSKTYGILYSVGGEKAFSVNTRSGLRFVIGGKQQTPQMFDRQVMRRFPNWSLVWSEAIEIIENAPSSTIRSQSRFHKDIYKFWRRTLSIKWPRGHSALPHPVSAFKAAS